jgi:maltoporin
MKNNIIVLTMALLTGAAHAELTYSGYMRSGTGFNTLGGKYQSFNLPGIPGNPKRLGNEIGTYGESTFSYWALKGKEQEPFFKSQVTLEYEPANNTQYEGATVQAIEAYIEAGYIDNLPFTLWAGKRFYRDADVHLDDFHYFADMSGSGAGLSHYKSGFGLLDIAFLQQSSKASSGTNTTVGTISKQVLDLRLKNIADKNIDFWLAGAVIPPAKNVNGQTGEAIGLKYKTTLADGSNTLAAVYGIGALTDLSLSLDNGATNLLYSNDKTDVKKQNRLRLVESFEQEFNSIWSLQASALYEKTSNTDTFGKFSRGKGTHWYSVGARPMYSFTDHIQWLFEAGTSVIKDETTNKTYKLTRMTTGPQLSFTKGQWARPVLRAFITRSNWNDEFKGYMAGLSTPNTAYEDKKSATQIGFQGEIWF